MRLRQTPRVQPLAMPATPVADVRSFWARSGALRAENADAAGHGVEGRDAGPERQRERDEHPHTSLLSRPEGDGALVNERGMKAVASAAVKKHPSRDGVAHGQRRTCAGRTSRGGAFSRASLTGAFTGSRHAGAPYDLRRCSSGGSP